mmetsp:Transcript_120629/g.375595  ORF Transcript_120629/g.375595 Transcript_120629/m.375595 type:complete len:488 (+) Transcript_120629:287-1750(+)
MDTGAPDFSSYLDSDAVYPVPGEGGGWEQQPLKLSGDFYGEVDDVTRGVSMLAVPPDAEWSFSDDAPGGIDHYDKSGDAFRGIHMDVNPDEFYMQDELGMPHCLGGLPDGLDKSGLHCEETENIISAHPGVVRRFTEANRPPPTPSNPLFQFAATAIRLHSTAPFEIGNLVLEFLADRVKSSIKKVNFAKFAIKAEVFVDSSSCLLKVRVYEEVCGAFRVEFMRRAGDCLAFGEAHRMAVERLAAHLPAFPAAAGTPELPKACPLGRGLDGAGTEGLLPLLDMADDTSHPDLQAESACSLLELARDGPEARRLCNARAFDGLKKLLRSSQDRVAFPAACTVSALAQHPEAAQCFADEGIVPVIADRIRSTATSELVQQELSHALRTALTSCATALSKQVSDEIVEALADVTKDARIGGGPPERRLDGACGPPPGEAAVVQCGGLGLAAADFGAARRSQPPACPAPVQPCTPGPPGASRAPGPSRATS